MLGKIAGAYLGNKIAGRYNSGGNGIIVGALAPVLARRAFGPLGLVLAGGYEAKKLYDRSKRRPAA